MLVQIEDELQKDFDIFAKKNGILISRMYDMNVKDGKKQYAFDANKSDMVCQAFAKQAYEKYKDAGRAGTFKDKLNTVQIQLKEIYKKLDTVKDIRAYMEHGMIENQMDALAQILGFQGKTDGKFEKYMEGKYGNASGLNYYKKEAGSCTKKLPIWQTGKKKNLYTLGKNTSQKCKKRSVPYPLFPGRITLIQINAA